MREFGITFSEGLRKGLRPFTVSIPKKEMLIECFNWMPHENGLLAHEELERIFDEPIQIIVIPTTHPAINNLGFFIEWPPPV